MEVRPVTRPKRPHSAAVRGRAGGRAPETASSSFAAYTGASSPRRASPRKPSPPQDKGDWLAGAEISPGRREKHSVQLAFLQSEKMLNWWGDSIMSRAPHLQMRPPTKLPSPPPVPRSPPARSPPPSRPRRMRPKGAPRSAPPDNTASLSADAPAGTSAGPASTGNASRPASARSAAARSTASPRAAFIVGGRPNRMLRPPAHRPVSQQDVYAMMAGEGGILSADVSRHVDAARKAAAARAAARHAAEQMATKEREAAKCRAEAEAFYSECNRLRRLFGLSEREREPDRQAQAATKEAEAAAGRAARAAAAAVVATAATSRPATATATGRPGTATARPGTARPVTSHGETPRQRASSARAYTSHVSGDEARPPAPSAARPTSAHDTGTSAEPLFQLDVAMDTRRRPSVRVSLSPLFARAPDAPIYSDLESTPETSPEPDAMPEPLLELDVAMDAAERLPVVRVALSPPGRRSRLTPGA